MRKLKIGDEIEMQTLASTDFATEGVKIAMAITIFAKLA